MQEARAKVAEAILKKIRISPGEIAYSSQVPLIQIYRIAKEFSEKELITIEEGENSKTYQTKDEKALIAVMHSADDEIDLGNDDKAPAHDKPAKEEPVISTGRHNGKFIYNKVAYSKSMCALKVVSAYMEKKNPTLDELKEVFPDEIVSRFGVVNLLKSAKELSGRTPRYYMNEDQILTTSDGKKVVVTNQWTLERFLKFAEAAGKVGFKVKAE